MESDSQPPPSAAHSSTHRFADFVGTVIAVITLALPLLAITHYSPSQLASWQSTPYPIPGLRNTQP